VVRLWTQAAAFQCPSSFPYNLDMALGHVHLCGPHKPRVLYRVRLALARKRFGYFVVPTDTSDERRLYAQQKTSPVAVSTSPSSGVKQAVFFATVHLQKLPCV
jgi:hypothetical protein